MKLQYVNAESLGDYLETKQGRVLGVVAFGHAESQVEALPMLRIDIPVLGLQNGTYEVWSSEKVVISFQENGVRGAHDDEVMFGQISFSQPLGEQLQSLASEGYKRIFECIDRLGFPYLQRVWHYFPNINENENGLERYRCFNIGRHEAFVEKKLEIGKKTAPAASALGSSGGALVMYFIASTKQGVTIENPRQTQAYFYPDLFGPRSPIFSRAILSQIGNQSCFFISGTASIVGHETLHHGNIKMQTQETLQNIRTLVDQVPNLDIKWLFLKVYLRRAEDLACVQQQIEKEFGTGQEIVYLHSDICRADLLVEIEGAYVEEDMH